MPTGHQLPALQAEEVEELQASYVDLFEETLR